jgi:hypothetical protein
VSCPFPNGIVIEINTVDTSTLKDDESETSGINYDFPEKKTERLSIMSLLTDGINVDVMLKREL